MMKQSSKNMCTKVIFTFCAIFLVLLIIIMILIIYMKNYKNPNNKKLAEAQIEEKKAQVGDINFNYAEGPDNGPALVLLHAQLLDWYTYSEVLPELSKQFHVYAIDYPGHGKTTVPEGYEMSAKQIGSDLAKFITEIIKEPIYVTGNSSGGLLTTWLAANEPDLVKAILLEDPPLFSAEYPEIKQTIAYRSFTTSHSAMENGYNGDFLNYWIKNSTKFFQTYTGPFSQQIIEFAVNSYRRSNPDRPVEIAFLPSSVKEMIRGLNYYNPEFGNAFYEGTWNEGFDHEEALTKIECPVLLLHANYSFTEDGILNGAMSQEMADKAASLIHDCTYVKIDSSHVVNLEKPEEFTQILEKFFLGEIRE